MSRIQASQGTFGDAEPRHNVTPREELNRLLDDAIKMALRLIEKHGSHIPFGMVVTTLGERTDIAADDTEVRDLDALFETVRDSIAEGVRGGRFRAVALAKNVSFRLRESETPTPAIQITLDHERHDATTCYLPYKLENGSAVPGEIFATQAVEQFFSNKRTP
jgi:hypothetical protein